MDKIEEILVITQEECAELIQEISKIRRFGLDSTHRDGLSHQVKLTQEAGDVLAMIQLMQAHGLFTGYEWQVVCDQYEILDFEKFDRANNLK